jgi:hypothetical protein
MNDHSTRGRVKMGLDFMAGLKSAKNADVETTAAITWRSAVLFHVAVTDKEIIFLLF